MNGVNVNGTEEKYGLENEGRNQSSSLHQVPKIEQIPTVLLDSAGCVHGFITPTEAENRLRKCDFSGALILRADQPLFPPNFRLSWLSPSSHSVIHFPITRVCGEYFLFGKPFTTIYDLIQTFITESQTRVLQLQPPSPIKLLNRQRIVILPFYGMLNTDEISFCEGDLLTEIQRVDSDWLWARLQKNGKSGLVAVQLTIPLSDKNMKAEELPYFHDEPVNVLMKQLTHFGSGCYLQRRSTAYFNSYTLMVNTGAHIRKFQIEQTREGNFEIEDRVFSTIPDIIEKYTGEEICEGFSLMRAILTNTNEKNIGKKVDNTFHCLNGANVCTKTVLEANAYRRCKKDKWKSCCAILNDSTGSQLYISCHDKKTKPKLILDLNFCFVYKIPDESFGRNNCLLVALNRLDVYPSVCLSFENEGIHLKWFYALRLRCFGCRHSPYPFALMPFIQDYFLRSTSVIHLTLTSFRSNHLKSDCLYDAAVVINGLVLIRTQQMMPVKNTILFNRCFLLQYIPPGACSLSFYLCSFNQLMTKSRADAGQDYVYKDNSPLYVLADDSKELCVNVEDNFEGFIFRVVRHRIALLPEEQYASFFMLLTARSFLFSTWIGSLLDVFNRKYFVHLLLSVLLPNYDLMMSFIGVIVKEQVQHETEATLFRCDSFCTCCISTALRMTGKDFVEEQLANLQNEVSVKEDSKIINALKSLSEHLPLLFRAVLSQSIKVVRAHFDDSERIARRVASVFFILRFVNPILTLGKNGSDKKSRHLPKTIQSLANQASSLNYCQERSPSTVRLMADLLDAIALSPPPVDTSNNSFTGYSKSDQLALLAFQVEQVLRQQNPNTCPIPEAYAVMSLLNNRAKKYLSH
ncbi:unnamed protein product [Thelazia callipaeda]|uniref:SH2 domain-containing protein n=1 Tax=Thelazia callipaeda TaxID=103827 RepID=A0A0N5D0J7_THECL|nr:unnamed protein product [Thelazia callipaeda]